MIYFIGLTINIGELTFKFLIDFSTRFKTVRLRTIRNRQSREYLLV